VQRVAVRIGVYRHGLVAGVAARADDPDRDLTPVRDEHLLHRGLLV
jgi:hypothetical protein